MRGAVAVAYALLPLMLFGARPATAQEPERVIRALKFEGNRAIPDEVIASAIVTTSSNFFARFLLVRWLGLGEKRYFDEQEFRRDVVRIEVLYRRSGYPKAIVDTSVVRDPLNVFITFRITEGPPIRVVKLATNGLDSLTDDLRRKVLGDLPLQQDDPFNRYLMQANSDTLSRRLKDHGYPDARVFTSFETDRDALTAQVSYDIETGKPAVFGTARVVGTKRIAPGLVRALLVARPGRPYAQDELFQSQRNLYSSELFRYATVNIDSSAYQAGEDSVPLVVQVNENRPRRVRGGIGYGTTDCFRTSVGWTTRNFLGSNGRILDVTGQLSRLGVGEPTDWGLADNICNASQEDSIGSRLVNYSLSAAVRRPAFLSSNNTLQVSVYSERRSEFKVYLRRETGTSVTLRRETPRRRIPLSLSYALSYGRTEATAASFCGSFNACTPDVVALLRQNRVLATLTGTATFPSTNSPIDPSRGSIKSLEVTLSSKYLGSAEEQQFTRLVGDAAWYRPITRDAILSWRVRGGMVFSPTVDIASQTGNFIPQEYRFYAGGPNDVRGFERNELGPVVYVVSKREVDEATSEARPINPDSVEVAATGGNTLALANVELRVPSPVLSSRLRFAAFVDAGGAWTRQDQRSNPVIRVTPGVGLRLGTPLGPARLDVAYNPYKLQSGPLFQFDTLGNLTPVPGEPSYVLDRKGRITYHIAVGQPF
ncbi:MAG TPA: BamA/TamA family outer membrane protein [Gemmatimonadales bacterium]|jgi:outer membrane protein assembly complex protein YaeT|nr:BamA/TamA family outer membrane protein [Gemmatimonadales bacterium]